MTTEEFKIEVVTDLADLPGWIDLNREYLNFAVARHEEATGQVVDPESQLHQTVSHIDEFLGPDGRFIAAQNSNGDLIGMVLLHRIANGKGEIKRLFVRPQARGTGLATRLMDRLETEAREMGLIALYLDTSSGLREAINFYAVRGFNEAPFDPTSVQDPEIAQHLVIMEKLL